MTSVTLYRATDRTDSYASGCCFSADPDVAAAYTDNPGFGGATVIEVTVDVDRGEVLRLVDSDGRKGRDAWSRLADALGADESEIREECQQLIEQAIDSRRNRATLAAAGYQWVVYEDTYPVGAVTWVYLGEPVAL